MDIWVKLIKEQKIIRDFIYKGGTLKCFENDLREICGKLDIPTPLILQKHLHHLKNFNHVKFTKEEFVESINFDELTLEYVKE